MPLDEDTKLGTFPLVIGGERIIDDQLGTLDVIEQDCAFVWQTGHRAQMATLGFTRHSAWPGGAYPKMFVQKIINIERESDTVGTCTVIGVGRFKDDEEKRLRRVSAFGNTISIGPIEKDPGEFEFQTVVTPSGSDDRWNIKDPSLTLQDTYISVTAPDTTQVGTALAPPTPPTPPAYLWGGYTEELRSNHPNGWTLLDRPFEEIIPGKIWLVSDHFEYVQIAVPD